jgi:hypothetical protein
MIKAACTKQKITVLFEMGRRDWVTLVLETNLFQGIVVAPLHTIFTFTW